MRKITIFDTTLRDGEQSPGASLSGNAKFLVAKALADLGVDVIEAGFPAASIGEAEAVARIAREEVDRRVPQGCTEPVRAARERAEPADRAGRPQATRDDAVAPAP